LRALERLYRRFLITRKNHGVDRRGHVQTHDVGRLGDKVRIAALAPGFSARKINLLGPQEAPDKLLWSATA
jgi:hypothetical protein